ncbi:restriction endonuclease PLD domain-containing protein [Sporocytophaga myxococcoides]|uniref:restriction endonuclease PLD domain-containing protein n=1 Tax=Sporocytophaga myxococcoides TaxID=153721 RepID=UPI00041444E7|nr:restriction endonuclease PLD domain-containing protein [Sporocytophaga myxococcoides]
MIIKKLLAPLVNNKILKEAEHCYIASGSISEPAFDLLMSNLPRHCNVDIVTGFDLPTHPNVLWKILKQYPGRVTFRIFTKNVFHSNLYIFDLPFRKRVAFVGSGSLTLGGLKDHEELSYKIDVERSVEDLKAWFRSYFDFGVDLSDKIIREYEMLYPSIVARDNATKEDMKQLTDVITGRFSLTGINFSKQYFKAEDYATLDNSKAALSSQLVHHERVMLQNKMLELHEQLKPYLNKLKLHENDDAEQIVSSLDPMFHYEHKVKAMWLAYGRSKKELDVYKAKLWDLINIQLLLKPQEFEICLSLGKPNTGTEDREYFRKEMNNEEYRKKFFDLLKSLGKDCWIEVAGEKKQSDSFEDEQALWSYTNADAIQYNFIIGRNYAANDAEISADNIVTSIQKEIDKLIHLYRLMKA